MLTTSPAHNHSSLHYLACSITRRVRHTAVILGVLGRPAARSVCYIFPRVSVRSGDRSAQAFRLEHHSTAGTRPWLAAGSVLDVAAYHARYASVTTRICVCSAANADDARGGEQDAKAAISLKVVASLALYTAGWFAFSVLYNTSTKSVVALYPNHVPFITTVQLCVSLPFVGFPSQRVRENLRAAPVEVLLWGVVVSTGQYLGNLFGNLAVADLSVSLLNIIKSAEPVVALFYCFIVFGKRETAARVLSLALLSLGIVLCNLGDFTFTWRGCAYCLLSNLFHVIKGVYSKSLFVDKLGWVGDDLFLLGTLGSVLLGLPALFPQAATSTFLFATPAVFRPLLVSCLSYYMNSWCAFKLMSCVSPVMYSLMNVYKRLFILLVLLTIEQTWNNYIVAGLTLTAIGLMMFSKQ